MANTCINQIKITGSEKDLNTIHDTVRELLEKRFPGAWVEAKTLLSAFGIDEKDFPKDMREWISDIDDVKDGMLRIWTESSWNFKPDIWRSFRKKFPNVDIYYLAEEFGNNVFETNDNTGKIFPYKYALDYEQTGNPDAGIEYFESDDEFIAFCRKTFGRKYSSIKSVKQRLPQYLESLDEENYAVIHDITIADWNYDLCSEPDEDNQ